MREITPPPGLHYNVRFPEYLSWPLLSQSVIKYGRQSMAHLKAAFQGELRKKPTDQMILGSALHTAFLEPALVPETVVVWKGGVRRGKKWDEFNIEHAGKYILTPDMHEKFSGMINSLRRHPRVREWLSKIEHVEVSAIGEVRGVPMKARCDALTTDPLVDLKKCSSTELALFNNTVNNFGYHIQSAVYRALFNRDRFLLIAVEESEPYDVVPFELSPAYLRRGEREAAAILDQYRECLESNLWPGRSTDIVQLDPPAWDEFGGSDLTIDGVSAF